MAKDCGLLAWVMGGALMVGAAAGGASDLEAVAVSPAARAQLPPGQVWQCDVDGVRVFSDSKCGAHASVLQLREVNVMDSAAIAPSPSSRSYSPDYYPPPLAPPSLADEAPDDSSGAYVSSVAVIGARERIRREQLAREHFAREHLAREPLGREQRARPDNRAHAHPSR